MPNGIKITEVEGKKFVAVEDFEKLEKEKEAVVKEKETAEAYKVKFEAEEKRLKKEKPNLLKLSMKNELPKLKPLLILIAQRLT